MGQFIFLIFLIGGVAFLASGVSKRVMIQEEVRKLYEQYGSWVFNRAKGFLKNEEAAWEAVQEVFLKVLESGASFRGEATPWTWIYRITTNHCLNLIRKGKSWALVSESFTQQQIVSTGSENGGPIDRASFVKLVEGEDKKTQKIILAYYKDDLTQEEIRVLLGISRKTIGRKIARFEEKTKKYLEEEDR